MQSVILQILANSECTCHMPLMNNVKTVSVHVSNMIKKVHESFVSPSLRPKGFLTASSSSFSSSPRRWLSLAAALVVVRSSS